LNIFHVDAKITMFTDNMVFWLGTYMHRKTCIRLSDKVSVVRPDRFLEVCHVWTQNITL